MGLRIVASGRPVPESRWAAALEGLGHRRYRVAGSSRNAHRSPLSRGPESAAKAAGPRARGDRGNTGAVAAAGARAQDPRDAASARRVRQPFPGSKRSSSTARAGMYLIAEGRPITRDSPTRARGGGPRLHGYHRRRLRSDPRARGWTRLEPPAPRIRHVRPARAGVDPEGRRGPVRRRRPTRARGGGPYGEVAHTAARFGPTRARGGGPSASRCPKRTWWSDPRARGWTPSVLRGRR